jgi:thiol-disulfide isomerase/thioredoxin
MRRRPLTIFLVGTVLALLAAVGAGAIVKTMTDDDSKAMPDPEVSLTFDGSQDQSGTDDLIGGDPTGDPAPSARFALLTGGEATSLASLKGTPIVVNFFASWCAPCIKEMPDFEAVHQELGDKVAFIGIDVQESAPTAEGMVERTGVTYTIGRDASGALFEAFNAVNMPSTFLIDADGTVVDRHSGAMTADDLRDRIQKRLLS